MTHDDLKPYLGKKVRLTYLAKGISKTQVGKLLLGDYPASKVRMNGATIPMEIITKIEAA